MDTLTKTHWKKEYNYDYIGAYSLPTDGSDLILTIKDTKTEKVIGGDGKKQDCFVVYFAEKDSKPMILNRTNAKTIQKVYGTPYIEDWVGKKIQLYATSVNAFGTVTDALRIRDFKPVVKEIDISQAVAKLSAAANLEEVEAAFKSLPKAEMYDKRVIELTKTLKTKFSSPETESK